MSPLTPEAIRRHKDFNRWWYYSIELAPGLFTPGQKFNNILTVRRLLRGMHIAGQRCLDIGAMEAMMSILMMRRGAARVLAYDRFCCADQIALIGQCQGFALDYIHSFGMRELRGRCKAAGHFPFDVVVFSGVLYHMLDPLVGMICARSLVRDGGLMLLETAAINAPGMAQHFNAHGRYYWDPAMSNYWFSEVGCLEYLCRFLRLRPLDCAYISHGRENPEGHELVRVALACRAEPRAVALGGDNWMAQQDLHDDPRYHEVARNFTELLDWKELATGQEPVPCTPQHQGLVRHQGSDAIDLFASMKALGPLPTAGPEVEPSLVLGLGDQF